MNNDLVVEVFSELSLDSGTLDYIASILDDDDDDVNDMSMSIQDILKDAGCDRAKAAVLVDRLLSSAGKKTTERTGAAIHSMPPIVMAEEQKDAALPVTKTKEGVAKGKPKKRHGRKNKTAVVKPPEAAGRVASKAGTGRVITTRESNDVADAAAATTVRFSHDQVMRERSRDINLRGVTISMGVTDLLEGAHLKLQPGHTYGLVGPNGVGKTTLLRHIAAGKIHQFPTLVSTMLVEQEAQGNDKTAVETVLDSDLRTARCEALIERLEALEMTEEVAAELAVAYEELEERGSQRENVAKAEKLLRGLSFTRAMMASPTRELSGGWRMRVALACALYADPDVLMLDEPTNHLDLPAIVWLQEWLGSLDDQRIVLLVSHDSAFLDAVCTDIVYFNSRKLLYSPGNFTDFVVAREERVKNQARERGKQEEKIKKLEGQIQGFKQQARKSKKGDASAGQVRSRKKQLAKLNPGGPRAIQGTGSRLFDLAWAWGGDAVIATNEALDTRKVTFAFPEAPPLGVHGPVLQCREVAFHYAGGPVLMSGINLTVDDNSRLCIMGKNGLGKSTLLQLIAGRLTPTSGEVFRHKNLKIGFFTQHAADALDHDVSPLMHMHATFPTDHEDKLRSTLCSFGLAGQVMQRIGHLSGGQKSRVILAELAHSHPHVLILDEPTNHLDHPSVEALIEAVAAFKGGVIAVSHSQAFVQRVAKELWVADGKQIAPLEESFEEYIESLST